MGTWGTASRAAAGNQAARVSGALTSPCHGRGAVPALVAGACGAAQGLQADRRLVHFEVHVQRGERWTIELTAAEEEPACERARQFLQRPEIEGVKVWKEVHDPGTGRSAGRVVLAETKPKPKGRWRFARWTAPPSRNPPRSPRSISAATSLRLRPCRADWPIAVCGIGGGCLALIVLAALAALGEWSPLG